MVKAISIISFSLSCAFDFCANRKFFIISAPLIFYEIFTGFGVSFLVFFVSTFIKVLADLVFMPLLAILLELAKTLLVKLADIILIFSHIFLLVSELAIDWKTLGSTNSWYPHMQRSHQLNLGLPVKLKPNFTLRF